jgi:hypothetical protein
MKVKIIYLLDISYNIAIQKFHNGFEAFILNFLIVLQVF